MSNHRLSGTRHRTTTEGSRHACWRLKKVGSSDGPFASVYFEDVRNREDARERFELEWRSMRNQLTKQGVSESLIARLDEVKDNHHGISGRAGRAIVATSEAVLIDDILLEPAGSTIATLGELPYLIPLIAHGYDTEPFLIAKVDHTGADLCVRDARGRDVYGETVDGDGFPVHKAHVGGQERYTDSQSLVEENIRKNLTQAVERAAALAREHKVALVVSSEKYNPAKLLHSFCRRRYGWWTSKRVRVQSVRHPPRCPSRFVN